MHNPKYSYRADIDGLRAVAIAAVIAFHVSPDVFTGGFVGVDIFFVISGFLITSVLQQEIAASTFSIPAFYARRVKRLFPALVVVLATTLVVGWAVLLEDEYRRLGKHTATSAAFASNLMLTLESGYFDVASEQKPLLHLWSLGVEEQFYLLWPFLIAIAIKSRLNLAAFAAALGVASFASSIALVDTHPVFAFFLPMSRFWELMLGGIIAVARRSTTVERVAESSHRDAWTVVSNVMSIVGILLIGISVFYKYPKASFPGWSALMPTVGSAMLIGAGRGTVVAKNLLSRRGPVFLGLISYPLYLWHWPLLSFARDVCSDRPSLVLRVALVAAAIVLAWLTYQFIERPLRALARNPVFSPRIVASLGLSMFAVALAGCIVYLGFPRERLHSLSVLSEARRDWHGPGAPDVLLPGKSPEQVLFFGDSYIEQYYPRLDELAHQTDGLRRTVLFHTEAGCAPMPDIARRSNPACAPYVSRGFQLASAPNVKVVVIGGSWLGMLARGDYFYADDSTKRIIDLTDPAHLNEVLGRFGNRIKLLTSMGKEVYVVLNPPGGECAEPGACQENRITGSGRPAVKSIPIADHLRDTGPINAGIRAAALRAGAHFIDPASWLCTADRCAFTDSNGIPYFKDAYHLRGSFVRCCVKDFDRLALLDASTK